MICRSPAPLLETKARGRILLMDCWLLPLLPLQAVSTRRARTQKAAAPNFKLGTLRDTWIILGENANYSRAAGPAVLQAASASAAPYRFRGREHTPPVQ